MGYNTIQILARAAAFMVALMVLLGIWNLIVGRNWTRHRLVLRSYRIGFEPHVEGAPIGGYELSDTIEGLSQGDPKFVAIIGRPAGFMNFLREGLGLSRRFEFVMSRSQVVLRFASFTTHILQCSKLHGINAFKVARVKQNPIGLFLSIALVAIPVGGVFAALSESLGAAVGLLALIWFLYSYCFSRVVKVEVLEGAEVEMEFHIYPPVLERLFGRGAPEMPLEDANQIVQIFRVLKDI